MTPTPRTPEVEAEAGRMRERRAHLARNIRQARILARQLNPAGTDFLRRYRRVTIEQGYLYPNPDRAAACQAHADRASESHELLRAALVQPDDQAASLLEAARASAELYAALAQTARF